MKALIGQSNDDVCQYPASYGKGGGSRFLGDAHATSLMEISNCRATLGRTGEGARPHVGVAGGTPDICELVIEKFSNCRAPLGRTGEGARPYVGIAGGRRGRLFLRGHCRPDA